ncbi:MAG: 23S rRNA (pseudouridine(1915)-N(3))-methyltransferase RlmH [Filifactor alocis]|nr:23S rRNA (pseudouridine(1915)-N(3))-methyltransferase RlmH [Filifactor alocis]
MKITIVSKLKKPPSFCKAAIDEYKKRLSRYANFSLLSELSPRFKDKKDCLILQVRTGKRSPSSEEFSQEISKYNREGISHLIFLIDDVQEGACDMYLSSLDISPELRTVLLLEQIYRAFRIQNNEPYHK